MTGTLFDLPEDNRYKYEPEPMSREERQRKISQTPRLETVASPSQSVTSSLAALDALPKMRGIKKQIIELLEEHPEGLTCSEFCQLTGREKPSVSPRFCELETLGVVKVDGVRATNTGSMGNIYKLDTPPI